MKLLNFCKKIFLTKEKNTVSPEELCKIKSAFLDIVRKYTSISSTIERIDKNTKNKLAGLFGNKFECSLFYTPREYYAIRFNDEMPSEEFDQVLDLLKNDMGLPDIFSEYDGYVWNREGYIVTLGLVELNYNYDVPMICVHKNISEFSATVDYKEYVFVADSINKPLVDRKIKTYQSMFYPIGFGRSFTDREHPGYISIDSLPDSTVFVQYKNNKLKLDIVPYVRISELDTVSAKSKHTKQNTGKVKAKLTETYPNVEFKAMRPQDKFTISVMISDISMIEEKLNQLLEETKGYYETK